MILVGFGNDRMGDPYELGLGMRPVDFWTGGKPEVSEINEVLMVIIHILISCVEKQRIICKSDSQNCK